MTCVGRVVIPLFIMIMEILRQIRAKRLGSFLRRVGYSSSDLKREPPHRCWHDTCQDHYPSAHVNVFCELLDQAHLDPSFADLFFPTFCLRTVAISALERHLPGSRPRPSFSLFNPCCCVTRGGLSLFLQVSFSICRSTTPCLPSRTIALKSLL